MTFSFVNSPELDDPLLGYRFGVFFLGGLGVAHPFDFRFQEVSGLDVSVEINPVGSSGEENSSRRLPGERKYQNLILKRGMPAFSSLRVETQFSLMGAQLVARDVLISILDENTLPLNSWLLSEAIPVHWSISGLDANSGQVIIETMELSYSNFRPFSL